MKRNTFKRHLKIHLFNEHCDLYSSLSVCDATLDIMTLHKLYYYHYTYGVIFLRL